MPALGNKIPMRETHAFLNSKVLGYSWFKAPFEKWAFEVQLDCAAVNPYMQAVFLGVDFSLWRFTTISVTRTVSVDRSPHFYYLLYFICQLLMHITL